MPVLTVSATDGAGGSIRDDLLGISDLLPFIVFPVSPQVLLTAAHESVHGFFETSQVRACSGGRALPFRSNARMIGARGD